jgi:hypothetical protein
VIFVAGSYGFLQQPARAAEGEPATRELEGLVRKADFDAAEKVAQRLLRSGTLGRRDVARVYLQMGIVASAKRDTAGAETAFRRALRLDGDLHLSPSAGPHVVTTLARAKAAVSSAAPIDPAIVLTSPAGSGALSVETPARKDDDGLVRRLSIRIGEEREVRDLGEAPLRFTVALPDAVTACATATASVLDEFGNELWPTAASAEVCRPAPVPGPVKPTTETAALRPRPGATSSTEMVETKRAAPSRTVSRAVWVAAAATVAAAVGTTVLGLVALERRDDYNASFNDGSTYDQQRHLRDAAATAEHRATGGAIVTGVLAITTLVLYIGGRF